MAQSLGGSRVKGVLGLVIPVCCLGLLYLLWIGCRVGEAEDVSVENKLKVAYLFNFAKFTTWPPAAFSGPVTPFVFCVGGKDPFGDALKGVTEKQVGGRPVQIVRLPSFSTTIDQCHLLYLSPSEHDRLQKYFSFAQGKPILLVSDMSGFVGDGGAIELRREGERLIFMVNNHAAQEAGLQLSSSLLQLAHEVY